MKKCTKCKKVLLVPSWKTCFECSSLVKRTCKYCDEIVTGRRIACFDCRQRYIARPIKIHHDLVHCYLTDETTGVPIGYLLKKDREKHLQKYYDLLNFKMRSIKK